MSRTIHVFNGASIVGTALLCALGLATSSAHAPTVPVHDRPAAEPTEHGDEDRDVLRIGAVAGVGFPHPLALEALVKLDRVVALGAEYSALPKTTVGSVEASAWAIAADARLLPFRNAFFIGVRGGRQNLRASTTANVGSLGSFAESASADTWFVNPRIGLLKTWESGFTLGIDAGIQIPIGATMTTTLPAGLAPQAEATMASIAGAFGSRVTLTVDLLRIGFLF